MAPQAMVLIDIYIFCLKIRFFQELTLNNEALNRDRVFRLSRYTSMHSIKRRHMQGLFIWPLKRCHGPIFAILAQKCDFWIIKNEYGLLFSTKKVKTLYIMYLELIEAFPIVIFKNIHLNTLISTLGQSQISIRALTTASFHEGTQKRISSSRVTLYSC
jgi:hypothetical protein